MGPNRDTSSRNIVRPQRWMVWAALAAACLLLAFMMNSRGQDRMRDEAGRAQQRAQDLADTVIFRSVSAADATRPMIGSIYRELLVAVQAEILTDPGVARVRLWGSDGTLIFSTDDRDKIGELRSTEDEAIMSAFQGATTSRRTTGNYTPTTTGAQAVPTELFQSFVPLRTSDRVEIQGAVEIDQFWAAIADAGTGSEGTWRTVFIVLAVLFGALAAWSFRQRTRTIPDAHRPYADEAVSASASSSPDADVAELESSLDESRRERDAVEARAQAAEQRLEVAETRADEAETRARELGALNERVEVAERRALDAERRLQELTEQVEATRPTVEPTKAPVEARAAVDPQPASDPENGSDPAPSEDANDLRARLARTAARKKPGGSSDPS